MTLQVSTCQFTRVFALLQLERASNHAFGYISKLKFTKDKAKFSQKLELSFVKFTEFKYSIRNNVKSNYSRPKDGLIKHNLTRPLTSSIDYRFKAIAFHSLMPGEINTKHYLMTDHETTRTNPT